MTRTCTQEVALLMGDPSTIKINNVVEYEHYWLGKLFLFFVFWILCHQTLQPNLSYCSLHFIHWRLLSPANYILRTCPPGSCNMHVDDLINTLAFQFFDLPISSASQVVTDFYRRHFSRKSLSLSRKKSPSLSESDGREAWAMVMDEPDLWGFQAPGHRQSTLSSHWKPKVRHSSVQRGILLGW